MEMDLKSLKPQLALDRKRMLLWGMFILFCGFVLGLATGGLLARHLVAQRLKDPEKMATRHSAILKIVLKLDESQVQAVQKILARRYHGIRKGFEDQLELIRKEVSAELTEPQARKFNEYLKHLKSRWLPGGREVYNRETD